jgi:hypothetical protein
VKIQLSSCKDDNEHLILAKMFGAKMVTTSEYKVVLELTCTGCLEDGDMMKLFIGKGQYHYTVPKSTVSKIEV